MAGKPRDLLGRQIAEEATCIVYQGTDTLTRAGVTLKVPKSLSFQTQREVKILQRVSHRYITQLHNYFESPDGPVLIFPLATGDLFGFIGSTGSTRPPSSKSSTRFLLALACLHLHRNGIWRRDIKPENVLVMPLEDVTDVLLADFGLANAFPRGILCDRQGIGSAPYIAPEMHKKIAYTEIVDSWSLGVTMSKRLTGRDPSIARGESLSA
jgi:serine/threonine protein kinase